jgi:alpha-beta hydrolase superfamily lysophospholipase
MNNFEAKWKSWDDIDFFLRGWEPEDSPKAVIALIHGLGEHTGRYEHVARALTTAGYAITGFDLRGHGKSGGTRGHFPSLDAAMLDIQGFLDLLAKRYPDRSQFLYGHSLGGLLVLTYALKLKPDLKGVIATGAGLRSQVHDQKAKVMLVKTLGSLMPSTRIGSGLDVNILSRDPEVIRIYQNDPLVHDSISFAFGKAGLQATNYAWSYAGEFSLPLLIMHGTADRNTYPDGSRDFAELAARNNPDVTLKLWAGLHHEIHNEPEKEQVFAFTIHWLDRHL